MNTDQKNRLYILAVDAGLLLFALLAKFLAAAMIHYLPDCLFSPAGITCPACGATRCVKNFFSGNFHTAFLLHPYLFVLIIYLAAALLLLNIGHLLKEHHCKRIGHAMIGSRAIILLVIGFAIFGTIRLFATLP